MAFFYFFATMETIRTEGLQFAYDTENKFSYPDLSCFPRKHLLILGSSGTGKTTLLHLLAGILNPSSGKVTVDGTDLYALEPAKRDRFRGRNIGLIFQRSHFISSLNVRDNLLLAQKLAGLAPDRFVVNQLLDQLNIGSKLRKKPHRLSQGEQQRAAIARALLNEPKLILADEPTSALDDDNCQQVTKLLEEAAEKAGASLVIVTHDQRLKDHFPDQITLSRTT